MRPGNLASPKVVSGDLGLSKTSFVPLPNPRQHPATENDLKRNGSEGISSKRG